MRSGRLVADNTPQALLDTTGAADIEGAFLSVIGSAGNGSQSEGVVA
jgi:ABC-2 type transport system ATP-binding protein